MVGAVLVHNERIIGEGYHQRYGEAHAEVNCLNSVSEHDQPLIAASTLYVSLEPCAHYGKTPPCADLIIKNKIPKVVIGCSDPFKEVDGMGIDKLVNAGVEVMQPVLEKQCIELNRRFFTFHQQQRPYIILKWAQSADQKIAGKSRAPVFITNEFTNRLVHKWRGEEAAIMVGTNTALFDNPSLTTRKWKGENPVRLVLDANLRLPPSLNLYDRSHRTIIFNKLKHEDADNIFYYQLINELSIVQQMMDACFQLNIQSVIVEGGAQLLQSFINEETWDEARVLTNSALMIGEGLSSPVLSQHQLAKKDSIFTDTIHYYKHIIP